MDILSLKEMVAYEEEAFHSGFTAEALMEAAGEAMARKIAALYPQASPFLILTGKGNNGGDGLVVARHLAAAGRRVRVFLTVPEEQLGDLPKRQLARLDRTSAHLEILTWSHEFMFPDSNGVVIDALLGVQARGILRGSLTSLIARLNAARSTNFFRTIALDLPTGLAAYEEGPAPAHWDDAVIADITLAVGYAKEVLCRETLAGWVGRIEVVPWGGTTPSSASHRLLVPSTLTQLLPRRNALAHKGDFGRLVIVAGSVGFTGAPILCAQAAQAMGAGLLSIVTRPEAYPVVAAHAPPEAMVSAWTNLGALPKVLQEASAIVVGPGLGGDRASNDMLLALLSVPCPLLIDADGLNGLCGLHGLNILKKNPELLGNPKGPRLLTPHPGEMARLIGRPFSPDEREAVVNSFLEHHPVTLLLKGTRTLIASPNQPLYINGTGNPGLSTGGSGDTLAGILGALLAQGLSPLDAARLGVWLHGHAADLALAERGCEEGLTPTLLSQHIGSALVSLRAQATQPLGLIERAREILL